MANRQIIGLGAVVFGIVLAAGLGIRSANSWLSRSTPTQANSNSVVSIDPDDDLRRDDAALDTVERDRNSSVSGADEQLISQANNTDSSDGSIDASRPLTPIEEAGTYVQRQQRVEEDAEIANTPVEVIPIASGTPVASQGNTAVNPQPTAPASAPAATSPSAAAPAVLDPVPALW